MYLNINSEVLGVPLRAGLYTHTAQALGAGLH